MVGNCMFTTVSPGDGKLAGLKQTRTVPGLV